jgi:hypothetical protein
VRCLPAFVLTLALACNDPVSPPLSVVACYEIRTSTTPQNPREVGAWIFRPGGFGLPERIELLINASLLISDAGPVRALPHGATMFWQASWDRADDDRLQIWFGADEQAVGLALRWSGRSWRGTASEWSDFGTGPRRTAPAELKSVSCS